MVSYERDLRITELDCNGIGWLYVGRERKGKDEE